MASSDITYDENTSMYVDEDGNSYYDSEGRELCQPDD